MKRKVVHIDPDKCNGCGLCVPNCAEGAIQIIDGKAQLVADNLCDGLGACLGECPEGAITIEERDAAAFDETVVEKHLKAIGREAVTAHAGGPGKHHEHHGKGHDGGHGHHAAEGHHAGHGPHHGRGFVCPSSRAIVHDRPASASGPAGAVGSELGHWPVKLQLVGAGAPFFKGKNLVVAADCAPVAYGDFHRRFMKGAAIAIQCPKFGDQGFVVDRLAGIMAQGGISGVTVVRMEVPCCGGLSWAVQQAIKASGRTDLPLREVVVGTRGDIVSERATTTGIPV
jgi:NAD-dependent dihydropyrimidine dehydrogenase PreA subunit